MLFTIYAHKICIKNRGKDDSVKNSNNTLSSVVPNDQYFNPLHATGVFLYPMETSENLSGFLFSVRIEVEHSWKMG